MHRHDYSPKNLIQAPKEERPIPEIYSVTDNDLARDNLENDIPAADLEDL